MAYDTHMKTRNKVLIVTENKIFSSSPYFTRKEIDLILEYAAELKELRSKIDEEGPADTEEYEYRLVGQCKIEK